jgi:hypothetical protein
MNAKIIVVLVMLASLAGIAAAIPPMPQELSGQVTIGGEPAPVYTVIEAMIGDYSAGYVRLQEPGIFGGDEKFDNRLVIAGEETHVGDTVTFVIKGQAADQTVVFTPGATGYIILSFPHIYEGGGGSSGSAVPPTQAPQGEGSLLHDGSGTVLQDTGVCSSQGAACLRIPEGTVALTAAGTPLDAVSITRVEEGDVPPAGALFSFAGYAFACSPDGATFSTPITLTITLTPEEWEALEGELSIQWYNPETGSWEALETTIDPITHTVSVQVSHFTIFGLFEKIESGPGITVTSTIPVTTSAATATQAGEEAGFPWLWPIVIVIVVIVAVVAYTMMKQH